MKLDRLLAILSILSEKDKVTAAELAEKFEVSKRTIYRDLDSINQAGIPVISHLGRDGGISLMENYRINQHILSRRDSKSLYSALKALQSITNYSSLSTLIAKLLPEPEKVASLTDYQIELSSWFSDSIHHKKIITLQEAIEKRLRLKLNYISRYDRINRIIEPYQLVFKGADWYLHAFCRKREAFRLFKLKRIHSIAVLSETFIPVSDRPPLVFDEQYGKDVFSLTPLEEGFKVILEYELCNVFDLTRVFDASLLSDDPSNHCITFYTSQLAFAHDLVLQIPDKVKVLAPAELRIMVEKTLIKIQTFYKR